MPSVSRRDFAVGAMAASAVALFRPAAPAAGEIEVRDDLLHHFNGIGTEGTLAVLDMNTGRTVCVNAGRAWKAMLPASTFKIPNALIALDAGVVQGLDEPFRWDGVKRFADAWNRDQTFKSAFRASAVWVFQEIARRIGPERMTDYLKRFDYGNHDIGGGIDQFWLSGGLRISAMEQIAFLRRFAEDKLPVSAAAQSAVKDIMLVEDTLSYKVRGKTGWANLEDGAMIGDYGWWVGWVEAGGKAPVLFAMNMDLKSQDHVKARIPVTNAMLRELGALPAA